MGRNFNVIIVYSGTSSPIVQGNINVINVVISDVPSLTFGAEDPITDSSSGGNFSTLAVTASINGRLFYFIKETHDTSSDVPLAEIQGNITQNKFVIESQNDFLTHIYDSPRDVRYGVINTSATNKTSITLWQYFPGTHYLFCGYLQTFDNTSVSELACQQIFTPLERDDIFNMTIFLKDASASFSDSDRQAILCYWQSKVLVGSSAFATNLHGERCSSLGFTFLYKYQGQVSETGLATFMFVTNDSTPATM